MRWVLYVRRLDDLISTKDIFDTCEWVFYSCILAGITVAYKKDRNFELWNIIDVETAYGERRILKGRSIKNM